MAFCFGVMYFIEGCSNLNKSSHEVLDNEETAIIIIIIIIIIIMSLR